jgi:tetrahydromethanopterin S-methyltransferase subunit B
MSLGSKKKDKDKDAKGASVGEASANYTIGSVGGEERNTNTTSKQEPPSTTTTNNKLSTREDTSNTQRETITSPSPSSPSQDEISTALMMATAASSSSTFTSASKDVPYQYQYQQNYQPQREEQQSGINSALDGTKDSIRKSTDEARRDIPRYTQAANEYHEQAIESAREIAENFLESQKEIINSLQSAWLPQIEVANRVVTSGWMSPRNFIQVYTNMVSNFADNIIAASRLANNMIFANMDAFRTTIQQTRDNTKEISRINVNTARSLEQTARDVTEGYSPSSTSSGSYNNREGGYSFSQEGVREQQHQQIPSAQNEEDTQNVLEAQNHVAGQRRQQTVTNIPRAAAVGQALKDMRFPADKKRILLFLQERSNTNPDYQKMLSLLNSVEDRQYQNVSDVTNAAGLVG